MVAVHSHDDEYQRQSAPVLELFPRTPQVQGNDLPALIGDFFNWLETAWKLPFYPADSKRDPLPVPIALAEGFYTVRDLNRLYGYQEESIHNMLKRSGIFPSQCGKGGRYYFYKSQDLRPQIASWEWQRLLQAVDQWWLRFFSPACGTCQNCRKFEHMPLTRQVYCCSNTQLKLLRSVFTTFLEEVDRLGSVGVWWDEHQPDTWGRATCPAWGIVLIYLLDRRLLHLSNEELLQLKPVCNKGPQNLTRLWRHRHPEEYEQFLQAMKATNLRNETNQTQILMLLGLLVLLKYGLSGIAELGRALSPEEIQQMCHERRLVTRHLGFGLFLPFPLTKDIRVGHVILDDIRYCIWHYAAAHIQTSKRWNTGPHNWQPLLVSVVNWLRLVFGEALVIFERSATLLLSKNEKRWQGNAYNSTLTVT
jgi:hypothetical protein